MVTPNYKIECLTDKNRRGQVKPLLEYIVLSARSVNLCFSKYKYDYRINKIPLAECYSVFVYKNFRSQGNFKYIK